MFRLEAVGFAALRLCSAVRVNSSIFQQSASAHDFKMTNQTPLTLALERFAFRLRFGFWFASHVATLPQSYASRQSNAEPKPCSGGSMKRIGRITCGAMRSSTSRSLKASRTSRNAPRSR